MQFRLYMSTYMYADPNFCQRGSKFDVFFFFFYIFLVVEGIIEDPNTIVIRPSLDRQQKAIYIT